MTQDLIATLKKLRLGRLVPTLPTRLRQAREKQMDPEVFLELVLSDEVQRRASQRVQRRAVKAKLDPQMVFESWDRTAKVSYDTNLVSRLQTLQFIEDHHHVLLMGPVGVGKTMLAHSLGRLAIERGLSVLCESADKLFLRLRGARLDESHSQELRKLIRLDLLIIDDFGLRKLSEEETMDMYELVTARHRTASMIVTSNRSPAEWLEQMSDILHGQALVDRFQNNAFDVIIDGESYRKRQKPR